METAKIKKNVYAETSRLRKLLKDAEFCQKNMGFYDPIIKNVAWMKVRLDMAREKLSSEEMSIEYNNGGGQQGTKENPAFAAYNSMWKSYMMGMNKLIDAASPSGKKQLSVEAVKTETKKNTLELVRAKHKKDA